MANARSYKQHGAAGEFDAIVIGSGIGGLATAALMARCGGKRVLVLERHYEAGGFTHTFSRKGYDWDVGVHYIGDVGTPGEGMARTFDAVSDGSMRWEDMGEVYDAVIIGDDRYDFVKGRDAWQRRMGEYFPRGRDAIARYLELVDQARGQTQIYIATKGMAYDPDNLPQGEAFGLLARTTADVVDGLTDDPRLRAVLTAQFGDYGLPPKQGCFGIHALVTSHYFGGGHYPVGGSARIYESIAPVIEAAGGAIRTVAEVEEILVEDGRATGVRMADGLVLRAPQVISDAGAAITVGRLLPPDVEAVEPLRAVVDRLGGSCGHLALYLGFEETDEALGFDRTNRWVYTGDDHDGAMERYLEDPRAPIPLIYLSFPSAKDPDFQRRHPGRATVEIVTLARYEWFQQWQDTRWMKRGDDYDALKADFTQRMLEALYLQHPQVRGRVDVAELGTPLSTRHFANHPRGEIYGLTHTPERFREHRLRVQTPIDGLLLTGVDVAACGVGGALAGGIVAAGVALGDEALFGKVLSGEVHP